MSKRSVQADRILRKKLKMLFIQNKTNITLTLVGLHKFACNADPVEFLLQHTSRHRHMHHSMPFNAHT